jgi:hypothetical protein
VQSSELDEIGRETIMELGLSAVVTTVSGGWSKLLGDLFKIGAKTAGKAARKRETRPARRAIIHLLEGGDIWR